MTSGGRAYLDAENRMYQEGNMHPLQDRRLEAACAETAGDTDDCFVAAGAGGGDNRE